MRWGRSSPSCGRCPSRTSPSTAGPCVAEGIRRLRAGQVERRAGFDGEYGVISLLTPGGDRPVQRADLSVWPGRCLCAKPSPAGSCSTSRRQKRPRLLPQPEALNPAQLAGRHRHRAGDRCDGGPRHRQDQAPWWPGSPGWWRNGASAPERSPPSPSPIRRRQRCAPGWSSVWAASGRWRP